MFVGLENYLENNIKILKKVIFILYINMYKLCKYIIYSLFYRLSLVFFCYFCCFYEVFNLKD